MQTQRTPRANAGKVLVTTIAIENKIIGGRAQADSSPIHEHPQYKALEAYVLANPSTAKAPAAIPVTSKPPAAGAALTTKPKDGATPPEPKPVTHPAPPPPKIWSRPPDKTAPRKKK